MISTTVDQKQIDKWKTEHGKVFSYTVDGKTGYFKRPSRQDVELAQVLAQKNPIKSNETLAKSMWLGGDDSILKDDELFLGLGEFLASTMQVKKGESKEL